MLGRTMNSVSMARRRYNAFIPRDEPEDIVNEEWSPIPGYDRYAVSNLGRVMNVERNTLISQRLDKDGYHLCNLYLDTNKRPHTKRVHVLVAKCFVLEGNDKPQVNHDDGDKSNNESSNLEWSTPLENIAHAHATGLRDNSGIKSPKAKLSEADVRYIRQSQRSSKELAAQLGIHPVTVNNARKGHTYKDVV